LQEFLVQLNVYFIPVGTLTTLLVALVVVLALFGKQAARRVALRNCAAHQWLPVLLMVLPLAVIASEVGNCVSDLIPVLDAPWLRDFRERNSELFAQFLQLPWIVVFIGGCLLPGLGEELYCRGFLSRVLVGRYGVVWGTLLTSMLFGAMHLEPVQATAAFVLGVGLQYVFLTTRCLPAAVVVHTLNNLVAFTSMTYQDRFPIPGLTELPDGSVVHTPPLLMTMAVVCFAAAAAWLWQTRTVWVLPDGSRWSPGYPSAESPPDSLGARATTARPHWLLLVCNLVAFAALIAAILAANRAVTA
jgi:membrane protease YdiL (CAAX protease family)